MSGSEVELVDTEGKKDTFVSLHCPPPGGDIGKNVEVHWQFDGKDFHGRDMVGQPAINRYSGSCVLYYIQWSCMVSCSIHSVCV